MSNTQNAVKLRWIDSPADLVVRSVMLEKPNSDEVKSKLLARLGVVRHAEESYLDAWCRTMAEENGLPIEKPVCPALREALEWNPEVMRFVFFLA